MNIAFTAIILFGALVFFLSLGLPLVFVMGGVSVAGIYLVMGPQATPIVYFNVISPLKDITYVAIPLFVFMAYMLERAGIAESLSTAIQYWAGGIRGSLAMGTVIISTILAAMVGLASASIITMGVTVLPAMLKRGYDKHMSMGAIAAGSTLGILIPPSALGALYATSSGVSVGRMFLAGFFPGLLIAGIFIIYIGIRCYLNPALGPAMPAEERVNRAKKYGSLKAVILPAILVTGVLGSIFAGIATVTESAAIGAFGSILVVIANRRFTWKNFKEVSFSTMRLTLMIMWMMVAASAFRALYVVSHAGDVVHMAFMAMPGGMWGALIASQLILFILGLCLDEFEILIITVPIFVPVMRAFGVDLLWFGILFIINMEIAEISPPLGLNLFCMKAVAGKDTTMEQIWRSVIPFILLMLFSIGVIMVFPQIATYLPDTIIGARVR